MLTLTRRPGDATFLFHPDGALMGTIVAKLGLRRDEIKLVFDFPREIGIMRSEAMDRDPRQSPPLTEPARDDTEHPTGRCDRCE